jgi:hypothetical protein
MIIETADTKVIPTKPQKLKDKDFNYLDEAKNYNKLTNEQLTPEQEQFCKLYASDREFFGNGFQSYIESHDIDKSQKNWYRNARSAASYLLTKSCILNRINELIEIQSLNDAMVDKELAFVIAQKSELAPKVAAIKEYNILKQRITNKIKIEDTKLDGMTAEERQEVLKAEIARILGTSEG